MCPDLVDAAKQECVYRKLMALKDPKIVPFKMINCVDYINLRPTRKIRSLAVSSSLLAHCWGSWLCSCEATTGCYWKGFAGSEARPLAFSVAWGKVNILKHTSVTEVSLPGLSKVNRWGTALHRDLRERGSHPPLFNKLQGKQKGLEH